MPDEISSSGLLLTQEVYLSDAWTASTNVKELHSELPLVVWAPRSISEPEPIQLTEDTDLSHLCPQGHFFGHYLELMTIDMTIDIPTPVWHPPGNSSKVSTSDPVLLVKVCQATVYVVGTRYHVNSCLHQRSDFPHDYYLSDVRRQQIRGVLEAGDWAVTEASGHCH